MINLVILYISIVIISLLWFLYVLYLYHEEDKLIDKNNIEIFDLDYMVYV